MHHAAGTNTGAVVAGVVVAIIAVAAAAAGGWYYYQRAQRDKAAHAMGAGGAGGEVMPAGALAPGFAPAGAPHPRLPASPSFPLQQVRV